MEMTCRRSARRISDWSPWTMPSTKLAARASRYSTIPDPLFLHDAAERVDTWQHFADTAAHLGVRSTLSMHVPTDSQEVAASLNLYAVRRWSSTSGRSA
jgi:hypothetical protein